MAIRALWNHTVRVYREAGAESARDSFGHVSARVHPVGSVPTGYNARPDQNWGGSHPDAGPGDLQAGTRRWFLDKSLDVQERDILSVIAGAEAPKQLRVESMVPVQDRYGVHHIEVIASHWIGELVA